MIGRRVKPRQDMTSARFHVVMSNFDELSFAEFGRRRGGAAASTAAARPPLNHWCQHCHQRHEVEDGDTECPSCGRALDREASSRFTALSALTGGAGPGGAGGVPASLALIQSIFGQLLGRHGAGAVGSGLTAADGVADEDMDAVLQRLMEQYVHDAGGSKRFT